jgi:aspartate aminotransferase
VRHEIAVISDEIYEKLVYDGAEHVSIGALNEEMLDLAITCNGFSKAYAATGWRLGYAAGPAHVIKAAIDIQSHTTSGATTFAQYGAIAALEGPQDVVEEMRLEFERRRELMHSGVVAIPGLTCVKPQGAFYLFINIRQTGLDSMAFCERLLDEHHVAAVPGIAFGMDDHIRLSYATDRETIQKGVDRLGRFVRSLS